MIGILLVAAAASVPASGAPADPLHKVRCVREEVMGSLVQSRKACHTVREWRQIHAEASDEAARVFQQGLTRPNGAGTPGG